jgi:acyl-CoA ligase (AMP-forming) (exosortase A-associated)
MPNFVHELVLTQAEQQPDASALQAAGRRFSYCRLANAVRHAHSSFIENGLARGDRVAIYLEKRPETVIVFLAALMSGAIFVPINPLLKPDQVEHILRDCGATWLITSGSRLDSLRPILSQCPDLAVIWHLDGISANTEPPHLPLSLSMRSAADWLPDPAQQPNSIPAQLLDGPIDTDPAAILYTSGTSGKPKGVIFSHRNLLAGAQSVATYLQLSPEDRILALLPLSFDYGLSQLTTAFHAGAGVVLMNYLLPSDVPRMVASEGITGLAAVPPLWIPLADSAWPESARHALRFWSNSGGALPATTLKRLRQLFPQARPYLMYGLTEAFRSTYLPPEDIDRRPGSIGRAIPNAEVMVVRPDGSRCAPNEPGELVHRGALVTLGYWNDPTRTAERFRPAPGQARQLPIPEIAVYSGDLVTMDSDGYLYFQGRRDGLIKTSGYRVSPTDIEDALYASDQVREAAVVGVPHAVLGQEIVAFVLLREPSASTALDAVQNHCRQHLPSFMMPTRWVLTEEPLPRTPNGKIDRQRLTEHAAERFCRSS